MIVALPGWGVPGPSPDPGQRLRRVLDPRPGVGSRSKKIIVTRNHQSHFFMLK